MAAPRRKITRHDILGAIRAECEQRRGPVPISLVPVAANAGTPATRRAVSAELIAMRAEGLIDYKRDSIRGKGVVVTAAGLAYLANAPVEPIAEAPAPAKPSPSTAPPAPVKAAPKPAPPAPVKAAPKPAPPASVKATPKPVAASVPKRAPHLSLFELLGDLAELVTEQMAEAREDGDMERALWLHGLGKRILQETGGARS